MKKCFIFAVFFLCVCMMGCEKKQNNNNITYSENNYGSESTVTPKDNNVKSDDMNINEEIDTNLSVQAKMQMPTKKLSVYSSALKQFDYDKVQSILWPDAEDKDVTVDEFGSRYYREASFGGEKGSFIYRKNDYVDYIDTLCSYAKETKLKMEKHLKFGTREDVKDRAEKLLAKFNVGCELDEPYIVALNSKDLSEIQKKIVKDDNYKDILAAKNLGNSSFEKEMEIYYLEYSFVLDDIHVFGYEDPTVQYSGDNPLIGHNMRMTVIFSKSGIERFSLEGVLNVLKKESKNVELIGYEGIKKALRKRFGDVILTEPYKVTNIWMEYFPLIRKDSFDQVDVVPVWCCDFEINGEVANYTLRFHAVTGEEIS